MNEFTRPDRLRWAAVTIVVAAVAMPLSFVLWPAPAGVATPPPSLLPFFIAAGVVIPALAFGFGAAFLLFGRKLLQPSGAPTLSRAAFVSIGWLLNSWWPHANFHRVASGWTNLLLVDFFFHTTAIIAAGIVAAYFLAAVRERQATGRIPTPAAGRAPVSNRQAG